MSTIGTLATSVEDILIRPSPVSQLGPSSEFGFRNLYTANHNYQYTPLAEYSGSGPNYQKAGTGRSHESDAGTKISGCVRITAPVICRDGSDRQQNAGELRVFVKGSESFCHVTEFWRCSEVP